MGPLTCLVVKCTIFLPTGFVLTGATLSAVIDDSEFHMFDEFFQ